MQRVNRVQPAGPVQAYKTYAVDTPLATHFRLATCEEVDCPNFLNGWAVAITPDDNGQKFDQIIQHCGKSWRKLTVDEAEAAQPGTSFAGAVYVYLFAPGQPCFYEGTNRHVLPVGRPDIFSVRGGDWRGTTSERRVLRPQDWQESFGEHQDNLAEKFKQG